MAASLSQLASASDTAVRRRRTSTAATTVAMSSQPAMLAAAGGSTAAPSRAIVSTTLTPTPTGSITNERPTGSTPANEAGRQPVQHDEPGDRDRDEIGDDADQ